MRSRFKYVVTLYYSFWPHFPLPPLSIPSHSLRSNSPLIPLVAEKASQRQQPNTKQQQRYIMTRKFILNLDKSIGGQKFQDQAKEKETCSLPLLGVPQKYQADNHDIYAKHPTQTQAGSRIATSVSMSLDESSLVNSVDLVSQPLWLLQLNFFLFCMVPEAPRGGTQWRSPVLTLSNVWLLVSASLPSAAEGNLSAGYWARYWSTTISEDRWESFCWFFYFLS